MADDSLNERENMLQQREADLEARQADVEVQEKIITLRHVIAEERTRRRSSVHEGEPDYEDYYDEADEVADQDAPVFEYRAEDSEDEDVLERIGYARETELAPCEYDYEEVSDHQIRRMRCEGGMASAEEMADYKEDKLRRRQESERKYFEMLSHANDFLYRTTEELAKEEHDLQKRRDVVPDEAQMSKRIPAQDWALKHDVVSKLFAGESDGSGGMRCLGGKDAIVINVHSDQHGRIKGRTFAWAKEPALATKPEEQEEELPDYESDNASNASTIILPENQGPRLPNDGISRGNGMVRESQGIRNAHAIARANDGGRVSSDTSNQMNSNLLSTDQDSFLDASSRNFGISQGLRNAQAIARAADGGPVSSSTSNQMGRDGFRTDVDPFVDGTSQGMRNARAIAQAAAGDRWLLPSPNTFNDINSTLLTSTDDPFFEASGLGNAVSTRRAPLGDITAQTLLAPPGLSNSSRTPLSDISARTLLAPSGLGDGTQIPTQSWSPSTNIAPLLPPPTFNAPTTTSPTATNHAPSSSRSKRKLSTIEEDREYDADSGGLSSEVEKERPKKKASKKHFADLPRSKYTGGEVPSDDEVEYRDTLERL